MTDQQSWEHLGCAGHPVLRTPHIDRLAREGTRFDHAFTTSPLCMPARVSFLSGLYPHNHGMWDNDSGAPPPEGETFYQHLQRSGYVTAHIGKSHIFAHNPDLPHGTDFRDLEPYMHARGFEYVHDTVSLRGPLVWGSYLSDYWKKEGLYEPLKADYLKRAQVGPTAVWPSVLPEESTVDAYIGRQTVEFIRDYSDAEPFCLFSSFAGPHEPWDPPKRYFDMYDPAETPPPLPDGERPPLAHPSRTLTHGPSQVVSAGADRRGDRQNPRRLLRQDLPDRRLGG